MKKTIFQKLMKKYITEALELFCEKYGYRLTEVKFEKIIKNKDYEKNKKIS